MGDEKMWMPKEDLWNRWHRYYCIASGASALDLGLRQLCEVLPIWFIHENNSLNNQAPFKPLFFMPKFKRKNWVDRAQNAVLFQLVGMYLTHLCFEMLICRLPTRMVGGTMNYTIYILGWLAAPTHSRVQRW